MSSPPRPMEATSVGPQRRRRLRPLALLIVLVGFAAALLATWRIDDWRLRQRDARLRRIHTIEGTVERHREFESEVLGAKRQVWVYLPTDYPVALERRYPVLYMQDGQNVFDGATAFIAGKEWQVDETAEQLIEERRIEPLIVVAVDNGGEDRVAEYTPTRDPRTGEGGAAERYGRMLLEELKPWVDRNYRTRPGRESTGIAGSSLGGLFALYFGLQHPEVFSRVASLSTSVWWDDRSIVRFVDALPAKPETLVWTDMGTAEGHRSLEWARLLQDALVRKGWRLGVDLRYVEAPGATHDENAWAKRMADVLTFLYPPGPGLSPVPSPSPEPPALTSSPIPPPAR